MADAHEDLATLLLRAAFMLPAIKVGAAPHGDDIGPAAIAIEVGLLLDLGHLRGPERIGVGKIAVLAEQVGDDLAGVAREVEHRDLGCTRTAAEQPRLEPD